MTNRVSYAPQDVQKMCKQAERDHETKKLVELMERVKRQIAARQRHEDGDVVITTATRLPSRSVPLER